MLALTINGATTYLDRSKEDEALQQFWFARQSGDTSAKLVRVDAAELPRTVSSGPVAAGAVSEVALQRIVHQEALARQAGFSLAAPLYSPGTKVETAGEDRFRLERRRIEDLPRFDDAANDVINVIRSENREDIRLSTTDFQMTNRGTILVDSLDEFGIEKPAFAQLANLMSFGSGTRYLSTRAPDQRAMNVNRELSHCDREVVFRTRGQGGARRIYACVTPTYAPVDADTVLQATMATRELAEANAELAYDGNGVQATAIWMPDTIVDLAAGDIFKSGIRISTNDVGRGRIRISATLWRNLCLNLIVVDAADSVTLSAVHRGDPNRVLTQLGDGIREAKGKLQGFLEAWGVARKTPVNAKELLRSWVTKKRLKLPSRSAEERDRSVELLLSQWRHEPGDDLASCVNAVTRSAHADDWPIDIQHHLEREASRLVLLPRQRL